MSFVFILGIYMEVLESKSGSMDFLIINLVSGDLMKENFVGMVQLGLSCELEGCVLLMQLGKR